MAITKPLTKTNAGADAFISGAPDAKAPKAAPGQVSEAAGPRGIVKGKKLQISVTLSPDLLVELDRLAAAMGQSRAGLINQAIYRLIEAEK